MHDVLCLQGMDCDVDIMFLEHVAGPGLRLRLLVEQRLQVLAKLHTVYKDMLDVYVPPVWSMTLPGR